jgi:hypothetical protein
MKGRKGKGTGGANEAEDDVKDKPADRSSPNNVATEAEKLKKGGRAKRAHGGNVPDKKGFGPENMGKKEMGKVHGDQPSRHAGRKPRKSGGRAGSDSSPLTSSHTGKQPPGRSVMSESMD